MDVSPEKFVQTAKEKKAHLIGVSALLTTTMVGMEDVVKAMQEASLDGKIKVMIGGARVTQSYAEEIGADGYAPDAASAADKTKELLKAGCANWGLNIKSITDDRALIFSVGESQVKVKNKEDISNPNSQKTGLKER